MMKTCQVYLARLYYTIAKCTCQEVLQKNIKSKVISPRSITERGLSVILSPEKRFHNQSSRLFRAQYHRR